MFQNVMKMFKLSICLRKKSVQRFQATCKNSIYHINIMDCSTNIVGSNSAKSKSICIHLVKICSLEITLKFVYHYLNSV